jgi:dTDP-4-dehydrorhamnose reductase
MLNKGKPIPLWGGVECTVNRIGERYFDQFSRSKHDVRHTDYELFAELGLQKLRHPVLWERVSPDGPDEHDWRFADASLEKLREVGIEPIVGLLHHGSGPKYTSLLDDEFPEKLATYARAVAERYPWVDFYTPVNEPLTTARFSALYGLWHPHTKDSVSFHRALLNEMKGTVLAMREIRKVNPNARLVQTEDLGKTHSVPELQYQADFENERRWTTWDLLAGCLGPESPIYQMMVGGGLDEDLLKWFLDNPGPADVIGVNHYVTSERFLDTKLSHYPKRFHGGNGREAYADVEAVRVLAEGCIGPSELLQDASARYGADVAITEAHLGCTREEQVRWLRYMYEGATEARDAGARVVGFTVWSLLGSYDWVSLLCRDEGCYENGVYDLRGGEPRPTALAHAIKDLATGNAPKHPMAALPGWWQRSVRLLYPPVKLSERPPLVMEVPKSTPPLLIIGASGTLGRAFGRMCEMRGIPYKLLSRKDLNLCSPEEIEEVLEGLRPWAVINAAGYVRVDEAEADVAGCYRSNAGGPRFLAAACARRNVPLLTYSTDLVFDGEKGTPYVESDDPRPLNVYGWSKAECEEQVLRVWPESLVIRTSAFFGPWDQYNFLHYLRETLQRGEPFYASSDIISPTYVPDLVNGSLDLLVDREKGLWHLANQGEVSWLEFGRMAADLSGLSSNLVQEIESLDLPARRPSYSALGSERGRLMPTLENAMERWLAKSV